MSSAPLFSDRADAGEQLAKLLLTLLTEQEAIAGVTASPIVYALPRGGIPVAAPVARRLGCPLDIIVSKKITTPQNPELALGAVTSNGHVLWSRQKLFAKANSNWRQIALEQAQQKAQSQLAELAIGCPQVNPQGKLALLVDDGIATGMTIAAASQALKNHYPAGVWICAPVAPAGLSSWLNQWCDRLIILHTPDLFLSVSRFYTTFPQVKTQEALSYLQDYNHLAYKEQS